MSNSLQNWETLAFKLDHFLPREIHVSISPAAVKPFKTVRFLCNAPAHAQQMVIDSFAPNRQDSDYSALVAKRWFNVGCGVLPP